MLNTYKNRLQHYAQKHNLSLPAYCSEFEGPPHARRFRAEVLISGITYECLDFFPTLKEAEHSAAKVALETLSHDDIPEDEGAYKTLLQKFAQKKGVQFPKYHTIKSGPSHNPTFVSTVKIGTDVFQGLEAKTKKQAEMGAAKFALNALLKGKQRISSFNLQSTTNKVSERSVQDIAGCAVNKELSHTFKIRLHQYAQKHNLSLPLYNNEFEGPPHDRSFRAQAIISGVFYQFSEFFPTLKEAEHQAAKVAFQTLSPDDIQEDEGLYKTFLQEFAQKKKFQLPKYSTSQSGVSQHPTFVSTVEIGTDVFQGSLATTKKQAEMAAAKVAFNALLKR